jgi:7-cyano-7-deazaguanine synthase
LSRDGAVVLLSGGLDSAVALWWAKKRWSTYALTFKYGELNSNEVRSARRLAKRAQVAHHFVVDVGFLRQVSELRKRLTSQGLDLELFPPTYVPGRNTIFLGIAAHYAEIYDVRNIVTGHIGLDPFPDSKPGYIRAMNNALSQASWLRRKHGIRITTPFTQSTKEDLVRLALELEVPLELTWSCHKNGKKPCGKCQGCLERSRALNMLRFAAKR